MAMTNAERQARWRERQKAKLRNDGQAKTMARIHLETLRADPGPMGFDDFKGGTLDEFLAQEVYDFVLNMNNFIFTPIYDKDSHAAIITHICGAEYYEQYDRYVTAEQNRPRYKKDGRDEYQMPPLPDPELT